MHTCIDLLHNGKIQLVILDHFGRQNQSTPRTTFGKVGPLLAAKTGPGGLVLARTTFRMTVSGRNELTRMIQSLMCRCYVCLFKRQN